MKRTIIAAVIFTALTLMSVSCASRSKTTEQAGTCVIDSLIAGTTYRLCEQVFTSVKGIENTTDTTSQSYDRETTPLEKAFFYPDEDLKDFDQSAIFGRRYNMAAVLNHVIHSYELFCRKSSERLSQVMEDSTAVFTKADTLAIVAEDFIDIPADVLDVVLSDSKDRQAARSLLQTYRRFDGNDESGSPLTNAFESYSNYYQSIPSILSDELIDEYNQEFWNWTDKAQFVKEIDRIQTLRLKDANLSEEQIDHLREVVEGEKDIDRRTILALEYAKWDGVYGAILLGEILESGQYTRYLLEVWITWRALVQYYYIGLSSFAVIPNNYYDQMRVKCLNTILRHMKNDSDKFDACLVESLVTNEILHRSGSIMGNESLAFLADIHAGMFVHPRVLEQE